MSLNSIKWIGSALLLFATATLVNGCGQAEPGTGEAGAPAATTGTASEHSGWWCVEHGVPEGICAQCSSQLAADFQKKGDWCKEHNRPESQCFTCHPEFEAKFVAQYEAKFGNTPPARTE